MPKHLKIKSCTGFATAVQFSMSPEKSDVTQNHQPRNRVFRHRLNYNCQSRFSSWLYTIGLNLARNLLRWRSRQPEYIPWHELNEDMEGTAALALTDPSPIPGEQAESEEWMGALREALARLPRHLREPLLIFALDGCPQAMVAERLGCTVKAVETRIYHSRKRLRTELELLEKPGRIVGAVDCRLPS